MSPIQARPWLQGTPGQWLAHGQGVQTEERMADPVSQGLGSRYTGSKEWLEEGLYLNICTAAPISRMLLSATPSEQTRIQLLRWATSCRITLSSTWLNEGSRAWPTGYDSS